MNLLQSVIFFTLYLPLMPPLLLLMNKYYVDCLLLSFPFQQHAPKQICANKRKGKKIEGWLIQLFFCTLGSISHQLLIGHGSWHDRQKCHNKLGVLYHQEACPSELGTQVDLWMSLSIFSWPVTRILHVWGRRQTKSKTERRVLLLQPQLHTYTHTHTLATNICTTDTANVCQ